MNKIIFDIDEITDSRQVMEAKPNHFVIIFIYFVIALIISFLVWAYFGEIDIVVKTNGIVRANNSTKIVVNKSGKIQDININEGKDVKKGDILVRIDHPDLDLSKDSYGKKISEKSKEIDNLKKLKKCIDDNTNYFNEGNEDEKTYYYKFIKYQSDFNKLNSQLGVGKTQIQVQVDNEDSQIKSIINTLNELKILKSSVENNSSQFTSKNSYYNQFLDYNKNINEYEDNINEAKQEYYDNKDKAGIDQNQVQLLKQKLDDLTAKLDKYKVEFKQSLDSNIKQNEDKKSELESSIESNKKVLDSTLNANGINLDNYKLNMLLELNNNIDSSENELKELNSKMDNVNKDIDQCTVKSPIDGTIKLNNNFSIGDLIQAGSEVATVIPNNDSSFKVDLTINNADIANLKNGQTIKYHFSALPYKEYGELTGKIVSLATDSTMTAQGSSFYLGQGDLSNKPLYNYKGEEGNVKIGMVCEAQIVAKREKILYYILQKFNLMN